MVLARSIFAAAWSRLPAAKQIMNELEAPLTSWLQKIVAAKEPSAGISAFRFGLSEDKKGYMVYLAGAKNSDAADAEWAACPPHYLASKDVLLAKSEVGEWRDVLLAMLHFLGVALRQKPFSASFLGGSTPVYAGFVDGDLYSVN